MLIDLRNEETGELIDTIDIEDCLFDEVAKICEEKDKSVEEFIKEALELAIIQ